jgi:FkbH-like protein
MKIVDILRENKELAKILATDPYDVVVLSNVTVNQSKEIFEYSLRKQGINAVVRFGDYDNIIQGAVQVTHADCVIVFWELCNLFEGAQYKIESMSEERTDEVFEELTQQLLFLIKNMEKIPLVLMNKFTALPFSYHYVGASKMDRLALRLNTFLEEAAPSNVRLIDTDKVLAATGVQGSVDFRRFYQAKVMYTMNFFKHYSEFIKPIIRCVAGNKRKAIIFDCDNTLWKGVVGEDGFEGIEMSSSTNDGAAFAEVQAIATRLSEQGVIVGLCSKNNFRDVDEVIKSHPDMQLKDDYITIKKINWVDKVKNLREIAEELNIGVESMVFVDDSPFELNFVRGHLPEIEVVEVPEQIHEYPALLRKEAAHFYSLSLTSEDREKNKMYKRQARRQREKGNFTDMEDYLKSLGLKVTITEGNKLIAPRIAQMTQKTNQFNLTTKRYTEGEIRSLIDNPNVRVYTASVSDRFGDSGVTGLCVVVLAGKNTLAQVDTFLLSCRVIGRDIEYALLDHVIKSMKPETRRIEATYIKTKKNEQVREFFDKCSFDLTQGSDSVRKYTIDPIKYVPKNVEYIKVIDNARCYKTNKKDNGGCL